MVASFEVATRQDAYSLKGIDLGPLMEPANLGKEFLFFDGNYPQYGWASIYPCK